MTENNRLAFLIPTYHCGGMERVMSQLIAYISDHHSESLHLVVYGKREELFYKIPSNVKLYRPDFEYENYSRLVYTLKTFWWIRKTVKQIHPHCILSFGEIWNNLVLLSLMGTKYPVYISDRCRPDKSFGKKNDFLRKYLYPKATGIIAQTEKAKFCYKLQFKNGNFHVIGNPVSPVTIPINNKRENIVVSIGRLIDTKNFDQLINIFAKINKPDWKLIIVGGDALKQNNMVLLQKLVQNLGMQDQIILAGTQKDVNGYLLRARIFAFTSSSEGFPNVIGEAQSAGLPVVAYDCIAGPSDMLINDYNGYLVPLFDQETFKEKLTKLMDDESLREEMSKNAIKSIKKFSISSVAEEFYSILKECR